MIEIFYTNGRLNKNRLRESWVSKNIDIYSEIKQFETDNEQNNLTFSQVIYNYISSIRDIPICVVCSLNRQRFIGFSSGYNKFCSKKCAQSFSKKREVETRMSNTMAKFGVKHTSQLESVKTKQSETNFLRYGHKSPTQNEDVREKQKDTMFNRYGVMFSGESNDLLAKSMKTRFKKYEQLIKSSYEKLNILSIPKEGEIEILCPVCESVYLIRNELLRLRYFRYNTNPCIVCNPISSYKYTSQNEISDYISRLGFSVVNGNREILNGKEIDIYVPSKKVAIEFNGLYWHSELYKEKKYHLHKKENCEKLEINLIHIWEDDWIYRRKIILSRINNLLGVNLNSIMARKCTIKEVISSDARIFLNENHLQGYVNSSYRIGLYFNNELVSIATFGKLRRTLGSQSKINSYELYRFCSKLNTNIIGSFSKLINYFDRKIKPIKIVTYANRDWSTLDNVYVKSGFKFENYTSINYWYFDKNLVRQHRFQHRKDKLINDGFSGKTEREIMAQRGFLRVHDCGSIKYIKNGTHF